MLRLFQHLFNRKKSFKPSVPEETCFTDFSKPKKRLWTEHSDSSYSLEFTKRGMKLSLLKDNVFVWQEEEAFQARDFVLQALFSICPSKNVSDSREAGSCAFGLMFRFGGDYNYYHVLVSDKGYLRVDAVFNGNPLPLVGWIKPERKDSAGIPGGKSESVDVLPSGDEVRGKNSREESNYTEDTELTLIVRDTRFRILLNGMWVCDLEDDTILGSGTLAVSGQNWGTAKNHCCFFKALSVDSRLYICEKEYAKTESLVTPEKEVFLAERLSAVNRTIPALRLLKTALSEGNLSDSALFKASTLYASGKMYTEAESIARGLLEKNPENPEYVEHFAGLLYLQNKFQEGIEFLNNNPSVTGNSGKLQNLLGNFYSALVKWEDAAAAYRRASELEENGLFLFNLGDILEKINDKEAVKAYQKAASVFLNENNLTDLEETVHRLDTLDKKSVKTKAIKAKYYFASGEEEKALPVIRELTAGNTKDSALWYLSGLLKRNSRDLSGSSADFEKALDLEPDYPMYLFRLSENRLDEGNTAESLSLIDKALAGDKENGWFWNQKARCFMAENNLEEALELLKEAEERLPDEFSVWENKGEIYRRMGQWDSMADIFNPLSPAARRAALLNPGKAFNFCGNMYTKDGKYALALEFYQKAVDAEKENPVFLINKASADIEEGNLSEADALLGKAYEIKHSPEIYNLLGTLAEIKGEYPRAEVAFRQGLEEFPDEPDLLYSLVQHYYGLGKFEKADALLSALNKKEKSKRVQEITDAVQEKTSRIISCSRCGRKWAVPFYIPPQGRISLQAEPPDEMPAGRCPVCGKTFCIGCGKENLGNDGRFKCPDCNENLRLMDEGLIYTLNKWIEEQNLEKE